MATTQKSASKLLLEPTRLKRISYMPEDNTGEFSIHVPARRTVAPHYSSHLEKFAWPTHSSGQLERDALFGRVHKAHKPQRENQELISLRNEVKELQFQMKNVLKLVASNVVYEDVEVSPDEIETFLCEGKTYKDKYPNSFLAIDEENRKVLLVSSDRKDFIKRLREISQTDNVSIVNTSIGS